MSGTKHDGGKTPLHLIPPEFLYAIAEILAFGAEKYAPRNWEEGINYSRVYRAAIGHLFQWFMRTGPDEETGKSHLWHAACCVMFLTCYEEWGYAEYDDRPETPRKPSPRPAASDSLWRLPQTVGAHRRQPVPPEDGAPARSHDD